MRLSLQWLKTDYQLEISAKELAAKLTMAGLEVDAIEAAAADFSGVVVGKVVTLQAHSDAKKLQIATVDIGEEQLLQIVCGAPNVAVNARVAVAVVGAQLPNDLHITASQLRGVASNGMLCSAFELGISDERQGLLILPEDAPLGVDLRVYMQLDDSILDIDLTPNRGDAFSMRGLARETAILLKRQFEFPEIATVVSSAASPLAARVINDEDCSNYYIRAIKNIDIKAKTPLWLSERLRRAGLRCHDAVVDVTNYVMLQLGTPLHAFDLDAITGDIVVRRAAAGEQLTLLDGSNAVLNEDTLVIGDAQRALAIAGVMGAMASACSANTVNIVLEAACFNPLIIAGKARQFAVTSDAAQRFERGVDSQLQLQAINLATKLIYDICGGEVCEIYCGNERHLPRKEIILPRAAIAKCIGKNYDDERIAIILNALGCELKNDECGWRVVPPSWRFDLSIAEDLIEEIARIEGYDNISFNAPQLTYRGDSSNDGALKNIKEQQLCALGFQEVITYSFIDSKIQQLFFPEQQPLKLANPISSQLDSMRVSLLPSLVNVVAYNRNRRQLDCRIFGSGKIFLPQGENIAQCLQQERIAGVISGLIQPEQWGADDRYSDFFDIKGVVEELFDGNALKFVPFTCNYLHPHQSSKIIHNGREVGVIGVLHPQLQKQLGIKGAALCCFEIEMQAFENIANTSYIALSKFPALRRDLALVVAEDIAAAALEDCIVKHFGNILEDFFWFDCYRGEVLPQGKKSLAVALILRDSEKTLQDEEVDCMIAALVEELNKIYAVELR